MHDVVPAEKSFTEVTSPLGSIAIRRAGSSPAARTITRQAPQGACRFFMPGSGVRAVPLINGSCDANALIRLPFSSSTQLCSSTSGQLPSVRIDQLPCFQKAAVSGLPISCLSYLYGSYCQFRANTRCFSRLGKSFRMGAMRRRALRPFAA